MKVCCGMIIYTWTKICRRRRFDFGASTLNAPLDIRYTITFHNVYKTTTFNIILN